MWPSFLPLKERMSKLLHRGPSSSKHLSAAVVQTQSLDRWRQTWHCAIRPDRVKEDEASGDEHQARIDNRGRGGPRS